MVTKGDEWVTREVAQVMLNLVERGTCNGVTGGTIIEVSKCLVPIVKEFNDPGPSGAGNTIENIDTGFDEVHHTLESWERNKH